MQEPLESEGALRETLNEPKVILRVHQGLRARGKKKTSKSVRRSEVPLPPPSREVQVTPPGGGVTSLEVPPPGGETSLEVPPPERGGRLHLKSPPGGWGDFTRIPPRGVGRFHLAELCIYTKVYRMCTKIHVFFFVELRRDFLGFLLSSIKFNGMCVRRLFPRGRLRLDSYGFL